MRGGSLIAAALAAFLVATAGGSAATQQARAQVFTGYGFDACTAPSTNALAAWSASPYRALGIYLGGVNRACADGNLSPSWVSTTVSMGWSLLPLYVGLQAPCVGQTRLARISSTVATAAAQGRTAADDAARLATAFGLPTGSPVYFDMEGYKANDTACTKVVQSFVAGWVTELRANSFVPGVYGSAASTIRDVSSLGSSLPDAIWIANWNGVESVFGDPYVSDSLWPNHQRVHQYKGGHKETWGGVAINIDSNFVDGAVVGNAAPPPPPPPEPPAGSVGSGDGKATATWTSGAFSSTSVVTLTPTSQAPAPNGYAVQLTVTDSQTSTAVARFGAPVSLHLAVPANGLAPSFSTDGTTWKALPKLTPGSDAGYTLLGDGTVEIDTLVPGYFGLLSDTVPPSRPDGVAGRFVKGALRLTWQGSTDNAGPVVGYDVLIDGIPSAHVAGSARRVIVRAFHPGTQTVYRVRSIDLAGNASVASRAVVVVPAKRPADVPRVLPRWAFGLYGFQHGNGARPAAAPRKPPAWYWHWAQWRSAPFRLRT
ncbi:MAG: hypothetical protein QOH95_441 [Gaiellaceae bacterium]|nr:hypothetical protein [Gaiellaceae bacterium]